jgi:hypothetical protein
MRPWKRPWRRAEPRPQPKNRPAGRFFFTPAILPERQTPPQKTNRPINGRFAGGQCQAWLQKAGITAPLYFSWMNFFTSGECSALTSFLIPGASLLSLRVTRMLA